MKNSILKQINYLKEHNTETDKMCELIEYMGKRFIMREDALQLLMHFNEAQLQPFHMIKVRRNFTSSLISSRSSLFSHQIVYDKDYLAFLIDLTDIHRYEKHYDTINDKYLNENIEDLKCAFLTISLDYKKDFEPYLIHEEIDMAFYQMLERTLQILLYKTYFIEFWKEEYPKLEKYNPILAKFLKSNTNYLEKYNQKRKDYYFAHYEYEDVAFELESKILGMVWTTMLEQYPCFQGKEYVLSLVMLRIVPNLSMLYDMIARGEFETMEKYIDNTINYCKQKSLKLYLH